MLRERNTDSTPTIATRTQNSCALFRPALHHDPRTLAARVIFFLALPQRPPPPSSGKPKKIGGADLTFYCSPSAAGFEVQRADLRRPLIRLRRVLLLLLLMDEPTARGRLARRRSLRAAQSFPTVYRARGAPSQAHIGPASSSRTRAWCGSNGRAEAPCRQ